MRRFAAPLAVLALTAALAACTDEPERRFTDPTPEPSETATEPTTEPTSEPTTEPTQEPEALGPEETVRAWVAARNELTGTGDPKMIRALSSPGCRSCEELIAGIPEIYAAGGWIKDGYWKVSGANQKPDFEKSFEVATGLVFLAGTVKETAEADPQSFDEQRNFLDFTLVHDGDGWLIDQVVFVR